MPTTWSFSRSADDAKLGGVCGGVAARWGVDPVLVRVGAVLLALTGGVGLILYLAGWLLLPVAGTDRAAVDDLFGGATARWPRELWVTLVVVACIVSYAVFGPVSPFGIAPALALLAVWWFGFHRPRVRRARRAGAGAAAPDASRAPGAVGPTPPPVSWSGPVSPFTQAAAAWQARVTEVRTGVWTPSPLAPPDASAVTLPPAPPPAGPAAPPLPAPPVQPDPEELAHAAFLAEPDPVGLYVEPAPAPPARRGSSLPARRLRLVTVTALGLTWLGLGIADATGAAISLTVYAAAGLLVVALGLVAATRFGRARGLLPVGVALAVTAVLASGLLAPTLAQPVREASRLVDHPVAYTSPATFPAGGDTVDWGNLEVDLSRLTLPADATYRASVDTGRIVVRTPRGTGLALRYTADTGSVSSFGSRLASGSELRGERLLVPPAAGQPTLTLDLTIDTGSIEVRS